MKGSLRYRAMRDARAQRGQMMSAIVIVTQLFSVFTSFKRKENATGFETDTVKALNSGNAMRSEFRNSRGQLHSQDFWEGDKRGGSIVSTKLLTFTDFDLIIGVTAIPIFGKWATSGISPISCENLSITHFHSKLFLILVSLRRQRFDPCRDHKRFNFPP